MITLKDIIDKYSIDVPSWVPEKMLNTNIMRCSKSLFPIIEESHIEKNINDPEHKNNVIIYGKFVDNELLFKITINSYDKFEKMPLVECQVGISKEFKGRPSITQWDSDGKELEICY